MQILVRDNNVDQALRALKKKLQREGVYREMKLRRHFEKPSREARPRKGRRGPPRPQARAQAGRARRRQVGSTLPALEPRALMSHEGRGSNSAPFCVSCCSQDTAR